MIFVFLMLSLIVILEGTFISIPLVFLFLLFFCLRNRTSWIFPLAFFGGVALDSLYLRQPGLTSILLLTFILAVMLYERKFEIQSYSFVLIASLVGSFIYLSIFGSVFLIQKVFVTVAIAFLIARFFLKPKEAEAKLW